MNTSELRKPTHIETFKGKRFEPLAPHQDDVHIEDIAHALANQCRFAGHTRRFYSVGEHSCHVSVVVEANGGTRDEQLWGLLHDASEAYLVDLPTPIKNTPSIGGPYRAAERTLMAVITGKYGLHIDMPEIVRKADAAMLAAEVRDLMPGVPSTWQGQLTEPPPANVVLVDPFVARPLHPEEAEFRFLHRFDSLMRWRSSEVATARRAA